MAVLRWNAELSPRLDRRDWCGWSLVELSFVHQDVAEAVEGLLSGWSFAPDGLAGVWVSRWFAVMREVGRVALLLNSDAPHAVWQRRERLLPVKIGRACLADLDPELRLNRELWVSWSPRRLVAEHGYCSPRKLTTSDLVTRDAHPDSVLPDLSAAERQVLGMLGYIVGALASDERFARLERRWRAAWDRVTTLLQAGFKEWELQNEIGWIARYELAVGAAICQVGAAGRPASWCRDLFGRQISDVSRRDTSARLQDSRLFWPSAK
jgi:hypothetical protein